MRKLPLSIRLAFILLGGTICASQAVAGPDDAKPASPATIASQEAAISALPTEDGRDERFATQGFVATRSDPLIRAADGHVVVNLVFPERREIASMEADGVTLIGQSVAAQAADATVTAPRLLLLGLLSQRLSIAQLEAAGGKVEGNRDKLQALLAAIDPMPEPFNIITP